MTYYSSYLVCREHLQDVRVFLKQFFEEEIGPYNHSTWLTFKIPDSKFTVNLIEGNDQTITQNFTLEIGCGSMEELENYAKKFGCEIQGFDVTKTKERYKYHFIEIFEKNNICKMEISYCEH